MKKILQKLFDHGSLTAEEAKSVMRDLAEGKLNDTEIASLVTVFLMRTITISELSGFREGLIEYSVQPSLEVPQLIDIVGTGGDGKSTFNISTLACFIAAGAGATVGKHGNYGATSISGASNLMEHFGYRFSAQGEKLQRELDETGFTFLHAPLFHPALKAAANVRSQLPFRTFYNMLGPLVNPARPKYSLIGVYNLEMARIYTYILQEGGEAFTIIHSLDGYDEISLTSDTRVITEGGEKTYSAIQLGKRNVSPKELNGGATVKEAADIFIRILKGEGSWAQNAVVLANAALALQGSGKYATHEEAFDAAIESLESGRAFQSFNKLIQLQ